VTRKHGKRGGRRDELDDAEDTPIDRLVAALEAAPAGLHDLGEPTGDLPLDWPASLGDVYLAFDGARLFHEELVLSPAAEVARDDLGRWVVGLDDGAPIAVDSHGRVWRTDDETGEPVIDGTSLARWVRGKIDGLALLFDKDGEYVEDAFDDDGELAPELALALARAQVKRDARAPGPRWHLARLLALAEGDAQLDAARRELEAVVELAPELPWAWLDLARISERLGELDGAYDEAVAAGDAAPEHDQVAYFWAHAARLAARRGNDADRARCAERALAADPHLVETELAGAEQNLTDGDPAAARALVALAKAVAPRNLAVIDLARRIDAADPQN
jgi:tetratricopeptide (TPR) repeat protein